MKQSTRSRGQRAMNLRSTLVNSGLTAVMCAAISSGVHAQYTTVRPPAAYIASEANGTDGLNVVGDMWTSTGGYAGWLYNGSTFSTLNDPLASNNTQLSCVYGNLIGGQYTDAQGHQHGFVYDGTTYTTLPYANDFADQSVSAMHGSTIVGSAELNDGSIVGYVYNGSTYREISDPNAPQITNVQGISGNTVIGRYEDSSLNYHGFEYNLTSGVFTDFNVPGSADTFLDGTDGTTLTGTYTDLTGRNHGFLFGGGQFTTVDYPFASNDGFGTALVGVKGDIAVGYYSDDTYFAAPFEYQFTPASSPSSPASTPEPGSLALLSGLGIAGAGFFRRKSAARRKI